MVHQNGIGQIPPFNDLSTCLPITTNDGTALFFSMNRTSNTANKSFVLCSFNNRAKNANLNVAEACNLLNRQRINVRLLDFIDDDGKKYG